MTDTQPNDDAARTGRPERAELSDPLKGLRMAAAFLIVMTYIGIVVWLLIKLGNVHFPADGTGRAFSTEGWQQITHLLAAIGALVTTAAGVVIGVQVQQVSVASANRRAERSETEALDAKARKEKAQAAVSNVLKKMDTIAPTESDGPAPSAADVRAMKVELQEALQP